MNIYQGARSVFLSVLLLFVFNYSSSLGAESINMSEYINLGRFSKESINEMLGESSMLNSESEKIDYISGKFLGIPYESSTLIGDSKKKEKLTIDLAGVDCFTFLDYVEAMRLSSNYEQFVANLVKTRYRDSEVEYSKRNHFFTDWAAYNNLVKDVTDEIGRDKTSTVIKQLNRIDKEKRYLARIPVVVRKVYYIKTGDVDKEIISGIRTGDYIGIYSQLPGLDVSHTGIAIRRSGKLFFRNASSREKNEKVIDEPFLEYIENKPGIVILRPLLNRMCKK